MEPETWRNAYLTAVDKLIKDMSKRRILGAELGNSMMPEMMLDYLVMLFGKNETENINIKVNVYERI